MSDGTKTVQLRRYQIIEGELDAFLPWWQSRLMTARTAFGYTLEFAYAIPETSEFVWAVSVAGDSASLERLDAAWMASDERKAAFDGVPVRASAQNITLVDVIG